MPEESKIYTLKLEELANTPLSEVGLNANYLNTIHSLSIDIPKGFVITCSAFEDFLIANDMVTEIHAWLKTLNGANMNDMQKASDNIKTLFRAAVMPASIFEAIKEEYQALTRFEETMVDVNLSWIPDLKNLTGGVSKNYYFEGIWGINELEKIVKHSWQALFEPSAIFERIQNGYKGSTSIALVVKKSVAAEVSGKLYSYNPLTNNQNQQEIQAVLGMWRGVDTLELIPDHYIVNKQNEDIEEKNVMTQTSMLLKKGFLKGEGTAMEDRYVIVDISKSWQVRQKLSDKLIQDIALIGKTIEDKFTDSIELDWGMETGKIFVSNIKFLPRVRHQHSLSFNPNVITREEYKMQEKPTKVEFVKPEVIDKYVEEIESQISDLDTVGWEEEDYEPQIAQVRKSKKKTAKPKKIAKKKIVEFEEELDLEPLEKELFHKLNYSFLFKEKFQTVTRIYVDLAQKSNTKNINSDGFDGLVGINGEEFIKGFGVRLAGAKAETLQGFIDYGVSQFMKLAEHDKQKNYIYTLSDLTLPEAIKYAGVSLGGTNLHLNSNILLDLELEILRIVRNKKNFRRVWLSLKGINQVGDYKYFKNIIDGHALSKSPSFRFLLEIDLIPPFLNIADYLDDSVDGIILDMDSLLKQIIGTKVSVSSIMKNELFWTMLNNISQHTERRKIPLIMKSKILTDSDEFLQQVLKHGIYGITINADKLDEVRNMLHKLELKNLD